MAEPKKRKEERAAQYENPTYRDLLARIGASLRRLRAEREWTMEAAADRCGMHYPHYRAIEVAKTNVTAVTLARLADGFGVDVSDLTRGEGAVVRYAQPEVPARMVAAPRANYRKKLASKSAK